MNRVYDCWHYTYWYRAMPSQPFVSYISTPTLPAFGAIVNPS